MGVRTGSGSDRVGVVPVETGSLPLAVLTSMSSSNSPGPVAVDRANLLDTLLKDGYQTRLVRDRLHLLLEGSSRERLATVMRPRSDVGRDCYARGGNLMAGRNGDRFWLTRMPNCIGWMHRELEDLEGALEYDQEGLRVARQYHVLEAEANSLINLGIDHSSEGKAEETISAFHETREIFERDAWFRWRYNIRLEAATAWHWLRQGDFEQAGLFAQRLLDTANQHQVHKYIAEAHRLRAQIAIAAGDPGTAEAEFTAALDELQRYPAPLVAWRTYADLGRLRSQRGDLTDAQSAFTQAAEIVNACATNVTDDNLRATFLNSKAVRAVMDGANT